MTYVIGSGCVDTKDRECVTQCPVDCIYEGGRKLYINPDECIECGACEVVCPESAIALDVDLAPEELPHLQASAGFVELAGARGGARDFGSSDIDVLPER